ncbi:MAG: D-aminoacyl-tRNA deacylase [Candidatus Dormibacteria bacterium]
MRAVVARVTQARVTVGPEVVGEIGAGMLVLVGVGPGDDTQVARHLAARLASLRIFADSQGRMNRSLLETAGGALLVSQFTLFADTSRGHRPSFLGAAPPEQGKLLCAALAASMRDLGVSPVGEGRFGAHMEVSSVNDGPVTIVVTAGEGPWEAACG